MKKRLRNNFYLVSALFFVTIFIISLSIVNENNHIMVYTTMIISIIGFFNVILLLIIQSRKANLRI